jgi:cytochrome c nitrite reductase small subunit
MPRPRLATLLPILAGVAVGLAAGLAAYTFVYVRGYSYLLDDPAACANCHVMNEQMDSWVKSSHHAVATCNDCHTPKGAVGKYATKALNGWNHSLAFTTGNFDEPIRATAMNQRIARQSCAKCHLPIMDSMHVASDEAPDCVQCHDAVGHPS